MSRRFLIVGSICAALGVTAVPSRAARYVLVADGWGSQDYCTGEYASETTAVLPLRAGGASLVGLDRSLADDATLVDHGTGVTWVRGRGVFYGDLRSGRVWRLAKARNADPYPVVVGARGRSAILADGNAHVVVVSRRGSRVARHRYRAPYQGGGALSLSYDGRYASYIAQQDARTAVRAVAGGPARTIPATTIAWSPAAERLAYRSNTNLFVMNAASGRVVLDLPLPDTLYDDPTWSPDGRYLVFPDGTAVDVASGTLTAPTLANVSVVGWRPRHPHQMLELLGYSASALLDVAHGKVLWQRRVTDFAWSGDGQWLLQTDGVGVLSAAGRWVRSRTLSAAFDSGARNYWIGDRTLAFVGRSARLAMPPAWRVQRVQVGRPGHELDPTGEVAATRAGLALLRREFAHRPTPRDC